jgi:hypothetical protein
MSAEDLVPLVDGLSPNAPPSKTPQNIAPTMAPPSPSVHMQLQSHLFRLPRELRDLIYDHYLFNETGLKHDFIKNKLTLADGEHIDQSLAYTCRMAAAELQGLA